MFFPFLVQTTTAHLPPLVEDDPPPEDARIWNENGEEIYSTYEAQIKAMVSDPDKYQNDAMKRWS